MRFPASPDEKADSPPGRSDLHFLNSHVQLASLYARMNLPEESARERKIVLALNAKARREGPQPEQ